MPFYLVTNTTLIEADDEHAAAQKGIDQIRSGRQVSVTVQSDETTILSIMVAAKAHAECVGSMADPSAEAASPASVAYPRPEVSKKQILRRMLDDAFALLVPGR